MATIVLSTTRFLMYINCPDYPSGRCLCYLGGSDHRTSLTFSRVCIYPLVEDVSELGNCLWLVPDEVLVKEFVPRTVTEVVDHIPIKDAHQSRADFGEALVVAVCGFAVLLLAIIEITTIGYARQHALEIIHESRRE